MKSWSYNSIVIITPWWNLPPTYWFLQQILLLVEFDIYRWQWHRFLFQTFSLKTRVKPVSSPVLSFLIIYTSCSNWYVLISGSQFTVSFTNSPFNTIDTAITKSFLTTFTKLENTRARVSLLMKLQIYNVKFCRKRNLPTNVFL